MDRHLRGGGVEVGRQLNVATIVEDSVQRSEGEVRIIAQLINAEGGFHIWSGKFDLARGVTPSWLQPLQQSPHPT